MSNPVSRVNYAFREVYGSLIWKVLQFLGYGKRRTPSFGPATSDRDQRLRLTLGGGLWRWEPQNPDGQSLASTYDVEGDETLGTSWFWGAAIKGLAPSLHTESRRPISMAWPGY